MKNDRIFVSYFAVDNGTGEACNGNAVLEYFKPVDRFEDIAEIKQAIREKFNVDSLTIINWRRMEGSDD